MRYPSEAAAISADEVQIKIFAVAEGAICQTLVQHTKTDQELPPVEAETPKLSPCDRAASPDHRLLQLGLGEHAFWAMAWREGEPLLLGCVKLTVLEDSPEPLSIPVTLFSDQVSLPPTSCGNLADKCSGDC